MAKCKDCKYYEAKDDKKGLCWGIEINGNTDSKNVKTCKGTYFTERKRKTTK